MDKKKVALGLGAIFALLYASKDKLNKVIEEKKQEIAEEQWTKKNEVTLLSMQELEQRTLDEEKTLEAQINADNKDISLSEYSVFGRFPSDSEGVSYLESAYILPYIDGERELYVRDFSLSYFKDFFPFEKFNKASYYIGDFSSDKQKKFGYMYFTENNKKREYYNGADGYMSGYVSPTYTEKYGKGYFMLKSSLPKVYETKDFERGVNIYITKSFGFKSNKDDDKGIFLFVPLSFWVPKAEKARKFTFEYIYIYDIFIETNLKNGNSNELNNGLHILNLLNNGDFESETLLNKKKNQIDLLNFIGKKYVCAGKNDFYLPIMLYFPKENINTDIVFDIYSPFKDVNALKSFSYFPKNISDLRTEELNYFFNGLTNIKKISFSIKYKFLETLENDMKIVCNYDMNENLTDVSELSKKEIVTNSELKPKIEFKYGQINVNQNVNLKMFEKLGWWEQFQDEIIENYLSNFSEKFYSWINKNVFFRPEYSPNDEKNNYYQETKNF